MDRAAASEKVRATKELLTVRAKETEFEKEKDVFIYKEVRLLLL